MQRKKKCKHCKESFQPFNSMQKACSVKCAAALGKKIEEKKKDAEFRERKRKLDDTVPVWTKKAQAAFNEYVRVRDNHLPCVSCGKRDHEIRHISSGGKWDCGHYRSVGAMPALRFEPKNAHKQCKHCNNFLSGNHVEYRIGISARLSPDELKWLEGPHELKRYRVEELKEITKTYKEKTKQLKAML